MCSFLCNFLIKFTSYHFPSLEKSLNKQSAITSAITSAIIGDSTSIQHNENSQDNLLECPQIIYVLPHVVQPSTNIDNESKLDDGAVLPHVLHSPTNIEEGHIHSPINIEDGDVVSHVHSLINIEDGDVVSHVHSPINIEDGDVISQAHSPINIEEGDVPHVVQPPTNIDDTSKLEDGGLKSDLTECILPTLVANMSDIKQLGLHVEISSSMNEKTLEPMYLTQSECLQNSVLSLNNSIQSEHDSNQHLNCFEDSQNSVFIPKNSIQHEHEFVNSEYPGQDFVNSVQPVKNQMQADIDFSQVSQKDLEQTISPLGSREKDFTLHPALTIPAVPLISLEQQNVHVDRNSPSIQDACTDIVTGPRMTAHVKCHSVERKEEVISLVDSNHEFNKIDGVVNSEEVKSIGFETNRASVYESNLGPETEFKIQEKELPLRKQTNTEICSLYQMSSQIVKELVHLATEAELGMEGKEPPLKKQRLSPDTKEIKPQTYSSDQTSEEVGEIVEELVDSGYNTVFQALPTECARQHALIRNVPSCWSLLHQLNPNDRDDPPEHGGGTKLLQIDNDEHCTEDNPQTVPSTCDSGSQLVPEENWQRGCNNLSFYTDVQRKLEDKPMFESMESDKNPAQINTSHSDGIVLHQATLISSDKKCNATFPSCFDECRGEPTKSQQVQGKYMYMYACVCDIMVCLVVNLGPVNLSKPRLRLGLSKRQKCRSLHDIN